MILVLMFILMDYFAKFFISNNNYAILKKQVQTDFKYL